MCRKLNLGFITLRWMTLIGVVTVVTAQNVRFVSKFRKSLESKALFMLLKIVQDFFKTFEAFIKFMIKLI